MPARLLLASTHPCPCGAVAESGCRVCRKCRGRARWERRTAGPRRRPRNARRRRTSARLRSRRRGGERP
jgi:hypothetical protein